MEGIRTGRQSPLAFHMAANQMNISLLAKYVRMNRWRVKRHLKAGVFKRLKPEILKRYADVFEITLEQFLQIPQGGTECIRENTHRCR